MPPVGFRGLGLGTPAAIASLPSQPKLRRAKLVATVLRVDGFIDMAIFEASTGLRRPAFPRMSVIPSS